jgi:hypothetical protein
MRWLRGIFTIGLAMVLASCGSSGFDGENGTDQLVLSFQGFSGESITQADFVGNTSADIDVCIGFCGTSILMQQELTVEPYTSARTVASFGNAGKSDILIDRYTVTIPGSGIPSRTTSISERIIGGRCANGSSCATDGDCGGTAGGGCSHETSSFELLLVDIGTKDLARSGTCLQLNPDFTFTPGTVVPETMQIEVSFSGSDATGERFNVSSGLSATFADFDNCESMN